MIYGTSITTNLPDVETMLVVGKATPESAEMIVTVNRTDLTVPQQTVYDDAVALVTGNAFTLIENTTSELNISRITSSVVSEDEGVFDFAIMNLTDQDKLRALLTLFIELNV